jgi:hypothetical protein
MMIVATVGGALSACALAVLLSATSNAARIRALQRVLEGKLRAA